MKNFKEKYTIPKEFHDRKIAEQVKRIEEKEDKNKKIFEKIINRFAEAIHFKITRDILLYGVCVLEIGNLDDLDEIIEIRKKLDRK